MNNILLTGANGFVGSYFIGNYSKKYNIKTFSFLNDSFKELDLLNIDAVIHLSALVHQMNGSTKKEYEKVNVTQTMLLAKKAKESGVKHFIFMSTVAVYGIETGVISEESDCKPINDYGQSKLKAELELTKLKDNDFKVSIVRAPIVNGYDAPGNMKSLINLINKVPILPFAGIHNRRSMVYVGNLCYLVNEIIGFTEVIGATEVARPGGNVFLAADDEPLSTTKLIELIAKNLDKKVYLVKIPFFESLLKLIKPSFHKRLYRSLEVDNATTKEKLGLKNPYSVEDGIKLMIKGESF